MESIQIVKNLERDRIWAEKSWGWNWGCEELESGSVEVSYKKLGLELEQGL